MPFPVLEFRGEPQLDGCRETRSGPRQVGSSSCAVTATRAVPTQKLCVGACSTHPAASFASPDKASCASTNTCPEAGVLLRAYTHIEAIT